MRRRIAVGLATLALSTVGAPVAGAGDVTGTDSSPRAATSQEGRLPGADGYCHKQIARNKGYGVVSQNFEGANDVYDAQGADDFVLKRPCTISAVDVNGVYLNDGGPADSVNVTVFKSKASGQIGKVVQKRDEQAYTDPTSSADFHIVLSTPVALEAGHYWVSVQANMSFATSGLWDWNAIKIAKGAGSIWRNPDNGFGTGCRAFTNTVVCWPSGEPDFAFALEE